MPRVLVVPDKFRGTADATQVAAGMAEAASDLGWGVTALPLSDGGEGLLDACAALCPDLASITVTGPDSRPVLAEWRVGGALAVVESARASGLALAGGGRRNDPVAATSRGTGELMVAAARQLGQSGTLIVGLGGTATTDGGLGAVRAVEEAGGLGGITLVVACDVDVPFADAAPLFAPQKGARPDQVTELTDRLERLAGTYRSRYGIDVAALPGAGAGGGLGGGLAVLGGQLRSGYGLVGDLAGVRAGLEDADRVVTGEGALDATSFSGKVVGGVVADASDRGLATLVVAGRCTADGAARARAAGCDVVCLTERFGMAAATTSTVACIRTVTAEWLGQAGT